MPRPALACPPRFATRRDPTRETIGPKIAVAGGALGTPFMPWQQLVADVAGEIDPATGRLYYSEIDLLTPRQSGKTTLELGVSTHRAFGFGGPQNIVYTAQTRGKARAKWADEHVPALQKSPFGRLIRGVRYSNDSEALYWANGSRYGIDAGNDAAGHGATLDLAFTDEAWYEVDATKEQAFRPAMITRPEPQLWVVSTAGNRRSTYLKPKVTRGRARSIDGQPGRVAYFEWSAPDDADPSDPKTWLACMPAIGYTVTLDAVAATWDGMKDDNEDEFRRAFLNQWRDGVSIVQVIAVEDWMAAADPASVIPPDVPRWLAVDLTPDRSRAAIGAAGLRADGLEHIEVVYHDRFRTSALLGRLHQLKATRPLAGPIILTNGAAAELRPDLEDEGLECLVMSSGDMRTACAQLYDRVPERVRHIDQAALNIAVAGATKRESDTGWTWNRRGDTDICPLVSVTGARWGLGSDGDDAEPDFYF